MVPSPAAAAHTSQAIRGSRGSIAAGCGRRRPPANVLAGAYSNRARWCVIATRRGVATGIVIVPMTLTVIILLPHAARGATLCARHALRIKPWLPSESSSLNWASRPPPIPGRGRE